MGNYLEKTILSEESIYSVARLQRFKIGLHCSTVVYTFEALSLLQGQGFMHGASAAASVIERQSPQKTEKSMNRSKLVKL